MSLARPSLLACVALVAACGGESAPPPAEPAAPWIPAELAGLHAPDLDLAGTWRAEWTPATAATELDATEIDIAPTEDRGLVVRVRREPDYGTSFHYETRGELRGGGLSFPGADVNANGDVLYPARIGGEALLVPSGSLAEVAAGDLRRTFRFVRPSATQPPLGPNVRVLTELESSVLRGYLPGPEDEPENENDPWWGDDVEFPGLPAELDRYSFEEVHGGD